MKYKLRYFSLVFLAITLLIVPFIVSEMQAVKAEDEEDVTIKKLKVTKEWINDNDAEFRPNNLTIHIKKKNAELKTGQEIKDTMINLAGAITNVEKFSKASETQYNTAKNAGVRMINIANEPTPVWMWYSSKEIFFYSEAANLYLNANSKSMFDGFKNLKNIDGLKYFNTAYVTNMAFIFRDCIEVTSFSPIADWDVGNVTSLRFAFASSCNSASGPFMKFTSFSPFENWNVQKVTDMRATFKCALEATDATYLKKWNVANAADMNQMFMRSGLTNPTELKGWKVVRVGGSYTNIGAATPTAATGNFNQMFANLSNASGTPSASLPNWTERSGAWGTTNGTFTPSATSPPASGSAPTTTKIKDIWTEKDSNDSICTVTKDGNLWTYEFKVSNDDSKYEVWEDDVSGFKLLGKGSSSNPQTGITSSTTIKNINEKFKVTKIWDDNNFSNRPENITVKFKNSTDNTEKTATNWTKNGSTWTTIFTIDNPTEEDTYTVTENNVNHYDTTYDTSKIKSNKVSITNKLRRYDITLEKLVYGNLAEKSKDFSYNVKIYDEDDNLVTSGISGITSNGINVNLKHGETTRISGIPEGYKYIVSEDTTDYEPSYKIVKTGSSTTVNQGTSDTTAKITLTEDQTVTFSNTKEQNVITGIFLTTLPFIILIIIGIGGSIITKSKYNFLKIK